MENGAASAGEMAGLRSYDATNTSSLYQLALRPPLRGTGTSIRTSDM